MSHWQRAIILVDMDAFFASIEQIDSPELFARPVGITNGAQGTCLITASYEARAYGIKTGMRLKEAQQLCPDLVIKPSRPHRYSEVSTQIMRLLKRLVYDIEVFSIDEAYLDVTKYQTIYGPPPAISRMLKASIYKETGVSCSIGVSGDKTTAKFAAKCQKPNGFTVIHPDHSEARLANEPVAALCGIGPRLEKYLAAYGIHRCGDMKKIPIGVLAKRFGSPGRRLWYMCQGQDPAPVTTITKAPKTIGHGKTMPPNTKDLNIILTYFMHMAEKVAKRLRLHQYEAQLFYVKLRLVDQPSLKAKLQANRPTNDGKEIYNIIETWIKKTWQGQGARLVQITALHPNPQFQQQDLLTVNDPKRHTLNKTIDTINQRYGEFSVAPARLLLRSKMHNVIAPSWRPDSHRQTIPD